MLSLGGQPGKRLTFQRFRGDIKIFRVRFRLNFSTRITVQEREKSMYRRLCTKKIRIFRPNILDPLTYTNFFGKAYTKKFLNERFSQALNIIPKSSTTKFSIFDKIFDKFHKKLPEDRNLAFFVQKANFPKSKDTLWIL